MGSDHPFHPPFPPFNISLETPHAEEVRSDARQVQEGGSLDEGGQGQGRADLQRAAEEGAGPRHTEVEVARCGQWLIIQRDGTIQLEWWGPQDGALTRDRLTLVGSPSLDIVQWSLVKRQFENMGIVPKCTNRFSA